MFEDAVEKLLRDNVTVADIAAAETGPMPAALWALIEANGLPLAAAPAELGGIGGTWRDCLPIARLAGYHAAPVPLVETMAVNWLLGLAGHAPVAGTASLGLATEGLARDVAWGGQVGHVLVGTGGRSFLLRSTGAAISPARSVAGEPRDTLRVADPAPVAVLESNDILLAGAAIRTAQIAGALARIRDLCTGYTQERVQFGRPIAKFQAVQHNLARLAEQAALAAAAAGAAFAAEAPQQNTFLIAAAKQVASEAAGEGAALAHGLIGAIGFTQEYMLHLLTRRLWAWRAEFGSARSWADAIGGAACAAGPVDYWPRLVRGDLPLWEERA